MRRAELQRERQALRHPVDRDQHRRAAAGRAPDRGEADRADAVDGDEVLGTGPQLVPHRADPGDDAAAERGEHREVGGAVDLHERALVGDRVLGERGLAEEVGVGRLAAQPRRARVGAADVAEHVPREPGRAVGGMAAAAGRAVAAGGEAHQHPVARRDRGHARPDPLDDAGALMTEDPRQRERRPDRLHAEVGVAEPGRDETDEDLAAARLVELQLDHLEGCSGPRDEGASPGRRHVLPLAVEGFGHLPHNQ